MTAAVLGVVCALPSEARHLGRTLSRRPHIEVLADGKLLALTGMGCTAAGSGAQKLVACGAHALVSFGLAGALDPQLSAGAIFLPSEVLAESGERLSTDVLWRTRLRAALNGRAPAGSGALLSTRHPVGAVAAKAALFKSTQARAVDMESFGVGAVAHGARLPFIAVRVIVDGADDALPSAVIAATAADGHTSTLRLLQQLLRRPRELAPLLRLALGYWRASGSLAAVARLAALVPAEAP